jgi:hypothetical protein
MGLLDAFFSCLQIKHYFHATLSYQYQHVCLLRNTDKDAANGVNAHQPLVINGNIQNNGTLYTKHTYYYSQVFLYNTEATSMQRYSNYFLHKNLTL